MTIGLILTIVFVVMELTGNIDWHWWQIVMPMFIEAGIAVIAWLCFGAFASWAVRR